MNMHQVPSPLSHLTENELRELIEYYYGNDFSVSELIYLFQIDIKPSKLITLFPQVEDKDVICPYCNIPMLRNWVSRTSAISSSSRLTNECYCMQCRHKGFAKNNQWNYCNCEKCLKNKQLQKIQKDISDWQRIYSIYGKERSFHFDGDIMSIDLRSVIYLLALDRQSVTGEIGIFSPIFEAEKPCSPDIEFTYGIIKKLFHSGYIRVDPASNRDAFITEKEGIPFDAAYAQYYADLGLTLEESKINLRALELSFKNKEWPYHWYIDWKDTVRSIWQELALYECLQYLEHLGQQRGFDIPRGDKTKATLLDAVSEQPTSIMYALLWSAIVKASDYYQSTDVSRRQAANSIVGTIQRHTENLRLGTWKWRNYGRYKGFRTSALYEVLFNLVLQIGDDGFSKTFEECLPSLSWIDDFDVQEDE